MHTSLANLEVLVESFPHCRLYRKREHRLAGDLVALQSARRTGNDREEETILEEQVKQIRKEIDDIGGWYYGCENATAVAWPESRVKHAWGKYEEFYSKDRRPRNRIPFFSVQ
jgi:hypothetical protein